MQSKILDINGKPFDFDDELQTENDSRLGWLQRHYSEHPASPHPKRQHYYVPPKWAI